MNTRIFTIAIERDADIILARQRTRKITQFLGFDDQDQTRITTALSEIVRNALEYAGGGRIEYHVRGGAPDALEIVISDKGPGIKNVADVLDGRHKSTSGMGIGITGARRLVDDFVLTSGENGTTVRLVKAVPKRSGPITPRKLAVLAGALAVDERLDPVAEVRRQNQDILLQYQELNSRQDELKVVNQELQDTNRGVVALYAELEERADHLRRADQLKSRFLSNMSHEFRTPLNSILSLSRILLSRSDGHLSAEQEKQVQFIRKSAENLTDLVNDLLDLARIEAGKTVVVAKDFTVADLFGALRGMLRPLLVGDAVTLLFDDAEDIPALVTDEGKVSQILRNFISNAIKFTERGEIRISSEYDIANELVTFTVADTGVGIALADLDLIWEEFGQAHNRLQARVKGTGLGLPLARRFAGLLGGSVAAESELGKGSTFRLTIPRRLAEAENARIPQDWTVEPGKTPVLVLEDNAADSFTVERALARSNYHVVSTHTVAEAKRALDHVDPAAIVLDVMLEGEESWRLLIELKQSEKRHKIPVIVASTTNEQHKALNFGADAYLDKPIDPAAFVAQLDALTGAHSVTKVLLVDDEEVSRYLIRQLLPRGAFQLKEVESAVAGLAAMTEDPPDVVLFDINMPEMNGFEFLKRMPVPDRPPVIAITAMVLSDNDRDQLATAAKVVSKFDLTTDVLVDAIRDVVSHDKVAA